MPIVIFLLFIIALAVAPEAMVNLLRLAEWLVRFVVVVIGSIASVWIVGYLAYGVWERFT
jgi:hypothetical protein